MGLGYSGTGQIVVYARLRHGFQRVIFLDSDNSCDLRPDGSQTNYMGRVDMVIHNNVKGNVESQLHRWVTSGF